MAPVIADRKALVASWLPCNALKRARISGGAAADGVHNDQSRALAQRAAQCEFRSDRDRSRPHAQQPETARRSSLLRVEAAPVVLHAQVHLLGLERQLERQALRVGVFEGIRERLLGDPQQL